MPDTFEIYQVTDFLNRAYHFDFDNIQQTGINSKHLLKNGNLGKFAIDFKLLKLIMAVGNIKLPNFLLENKL